MSTFGLSFDILLSESVHIRECWEGPWLASQVLRKDYHLYAQEAQAAGISSVSPQSVRDGFRAAFKSINSAHPLYGKHSSPPLSPEEWWTSLIRECMIKAGAERSQIETGMNKLGPALLARFESEKGYRNFPETIAVLEELKRLGIKTSVVSNADPRILRTLEALHILPLLSHSPTLSWDVEVAKPSREIFQAACQACDEEMGEGVLMVGDELKA
ncbi:hypothetical protein P7C73_g447, partial [Tremellales sp. Uapishka_1]